MVDTAAIQALTALNAAGVGALVLKGPAIARRLYAEGEVRGYFDVDLLVPRDALASVEEVFTRLGYARDDDLLGIDDVAGILHSEVWVRPGKGSGPIVIDLHWRLDGCEAGDDLIWETLSAGRGSVEVRGQDVPVLGDDGLALHVALHAAQHGPDDAKAIADLACAVERWPLDLWRRATRVAETVEAVPAFAAGLRLHPRGARIATELGLPSSPELEWKILHRDARPRGTFHIGTLAEARGVRERASILRRALFPTPRWIRWEFRWAAKGTPWLMLAYARHILRAPLWAARAGRYLTRARRAGKR